MKIVCFSLDGNEIVFGVENGEVYKFSYKSRSCTCLMSLTAAVSYLNFFEDYNDLDNGNCDGILVAAALNGEYIVWRNDKIVLKSEPPTSFNTMRVVFCIFIKEFSSFLVIKEKREICLWDLNDMSEKLLLERNRHLKIISCAVSPGKGRFVCVMENGTFEMYGVIYNSELAIRLEQQKKLAEGLRCCCFSYDEKFLAFGRDNGGIVVCNYCFFLDVCILNKTL